MDGKSTRASSSELTFEDIDQRIRAIPEGPVAIYNTPRWMLAFNAIGTYGLLCGVLPYALIEFMPPAMWMVYLMRTGLVAAVLGFAPFFLRTIVLIARGFKRWDQEMAAQLEHDFDAFGVLARELSLQPRPLLERRLAFCEAVSDRMNAKLNLYTGGVDRLGLLPVMIALYVLGQSANSLESLLEQPAWLKLLAGLLVITWVIGFRAALARLRFQLYVNLLSAALVTHSTPKNDA